MEPVRRYVPIQVISFKGEQIPLHDPRIKFEKSNDISACVWFAGELFNSTTDAVYDLKEKCIVPVIRKERKLTETALNVGATVLYKTGYSVSQGADKLKKGVVSEVVYTISSAITVKGKKLDSQDKKYYFLPDDVIEPELLYMLILYKPQYILEGWIEPLRYGIYLLDE
jgi:hypothetical protein